MMGDRLPVMLLLVVVGEGRAVCEIRSRPTHQGADVALSYYRIQLNLT